MTTHMEEVQSVILKKNLRVVSTYPRWEDEHGPTNPVLMKIFRFRIADPHHKEEYIVIMDSISCFRERIVSLEQAETSNINKGTFQIHIYINECFFAFNYVS